MIHSKSSCRLRQEMNRAVTVSDHAHTCLTCGFRIPAKHDAIVIPMVLKALRRTHAHMSMDFVQRNRKTLPGLEYPTFVWPPRRNPARSNEPPSLDHLAS